MNWTPQTIKAWTAGIVDGEGCIMLAKARKYVGNRQGVVARVQVVNTNKEVLGLLQLTWGGWVSTMKLSELNRKQAYKWEIMGTGMLRVLENIHSYLVIKEKQARLAMGFQRMLEERKELVRPGVRLSDEEYEARWNMYGKMRALNQRGRNPYY